MAPSPRAARSLVVVPLLALLSVAARPLDKAWRDPVSHDLDTYVAAGRVIAAGGDVHDFDALRAASPGVEVRAWVYPRVTAPLFTPLGAVARGTLARGWAVAQALALAGLVVLGAWGVGRPARGAAAALAAVLAWDAATRSVLVQGNVEAFVALGVAGAVTLGVAGRGVGAGLLLGAVSSFKLWPAALVAVPGASRGRLARWAGVAAAAACVVGVELASARPFLLWREVRHMDDRGPLEPSVRALLADLADAHALPGVTMTWPLVVAVVAAVTALAARRAGPGPARDALVWLGVLVIVPRVQDYGWVHALVPAAWAWSLHPASLVGALVAAVGHALAWRYASWMGVAATWAGLAAGLLARRRG